MFQIHSYRSFSSSSSLGIMIVAELEKATRDDFWFVGQLVASVRMG